MHKYLTDLIDLYDGSEPAPTKVNGIIEFLNREGAKEQLPPITLNCGGILLRNRPGHRGTVTMQTDWEIVKPQILDWIEQLEMKQRLTK